MDEKKLTIQYLDTMAIESDVDFSEVRTPKERKLSWIYVYFGENRYVSFEQTIEREIDGVRAFLIIITSFIIHIC